LFLVSPSLSATPLNVDGGPHFGALALMRA
jgi:hypothetical protein